ncbi:MAG TPA: histidine kinase [Flavisolibacter sp.]|nr:histidine kinase [Flavisolibacter sp.]
MNFTFFAAATAITLPVMFLLSQAQISLSVFLRKKYTRFEQRKTRFAAWIFISLPMTLLLISGLWMLFYQLPFFAAKMPAASLPWALLMGAVTHIIAIIINEGWFTYRQWKEAIIDAERLQKINWESRYEGLKQQVNPHFLFNSINTLSSLIHEDKAGAGRYVKEMSQVYRYLLRNNDDELVPLQTELRFIESYFHLLKTRFGNGIQLKIEVAEKYSSSLLPPLTLQMLVENAVKHNNVSKDLPLQINISCTQDGQLSVCNNLQKKLGQIDSTGIGLSNIQEKYKLLGLPGVQLVDNGRVFTALIPLVEQLAMKK